MRHSDTIAELAGALLKAQSELGNPTNNTKNAFLGNSYFPLPDLIDHIKPVLSKHGLSIVQLPSSDSNGVGISTTIMHTSGEWMSETVTVPVESRKGNTLAQVAGGTITYLRRYSLSAALNIASEDDDGNHGQDPKAGHTESNHKSGEYIDYTRMNPEDMKAQDIGVAIGQESAGLPGHEEYVESARQAYKEKDKDTLIAILREVRKNRETKSAQTGQEEIF